MLREEKLPGLFRGVTSPMAGIAFTNGVIFTSYAGLMNLQQSGGNGVDANGEEKEGTLGQMCLAGAGAGMIGS